MHPPCQPSSKVANLAELAKSEGFWIIHNNSSLAKYDHLVQNRPTFRIPCLIVTKSSPDLRPNGEELRWHVADGMNALIHGKVPAKLSFEPMFAFPLATRPLPASFMRLGNLSCLT
jgi:hypothetical protein